MPGRRGPPVSLSLLPVTIPSQASPGVAALLPLHLLLLPRPSRGAAAGGTGTERTPPGWRGPRGWDSPSCCCGNRCEGQRGASSGAVQAAALTSRGGGAGGRAGRLRRDRELLREGAPGEVRDPPGAAGQGGLLGWLRAVSLPRHPASSVVLG